jgi:hypothetical protein
MATGKPDNVSSLSDQGSDPTHIRGVSNVALAEATLKQKPKLLTKRMFKVGDILHQALYLPAREDNVLVLATDHSCDSFMHSLH